MVLMEQSNGIATVLAIAGFDPSGGAGIIADVKTIDSFGCRPVAAITSLTFQNSEGVFGATHETAESLRAQILPIIQERSVAAIKIGMLATAEMIFEVTHLIQERNLPAPIIDPVLRSTSGYRLMEEDAIEVWLSELLPLARLVTPNIPEAETLTGLAITDENEMRAAAARLREKGAHAVLVKGGHSPQEAEAVDVLDDGGAVSVFRGAWIDAPPLRGTGCMLSSAIASSLAKGLGLEDSVRQAKDFVAGAIHDASS
jgi:hydroxymethylpyrimidine kinase/phosphomethylpyrimidine kinase